MKEQLSVFYSWQSDLPNSINRGFIESAAIAALKTLNQEINMVDAKRPTLKFDKDTQGLPGTPPIVESIFEKISQSAIFLPDLSFIGSVKSNARMVQNPNVLIEYGWALSKLGHKRIVPVMNTAFGKPGGISMPFDMRHLRHPITYSLAIDASPREKAKVKEVLIKDFLQAFRTILDSTGNSYMNVSKENSHIEIKSTSYPSIYFSKGEYEDFEIGFSQSGDELYLSDCQHLFLRLLPSASVKPFEHETEIVEFLRDTHLAPMHSGSSGYSLGRNEMGAFHAAIRDDCMVDSIVQVFKNKEIWAINASTIEESTLVHRANTTCGFLPIPALRKIYDTAARQYIDVMTGKLNVPFPLQFRAGATQVKGYKISDSEFQAMGEPYQGQIVKSHLIFKSTIDSVESIANEIDGFIDFILKEAGVTRRP